MNGRHILNLLRSELADAVASRSIGAGDYRSLGISPWIAVSLLQKAIRRGSEQWALQAVATLLEEAPERLWRRLGIIAFEDIGVGDIDTVSLTVASLASKRLRAEIGDDWAVASYLAQRMCRTVKCRAADDLLFVAERHPTIESQRLDLTYQPVPKLLNVMCSDAPIAERAIALWYGIGTDRCQSPVLRTRRGEPSVLFDALCERGHPDTIVEIAREGLNKTSCILAPFLILLDREREPSPYDAVPDVMPPESMVGSVPGWCLDKHTRQGKAAIARFLEARSETARWVRQNVPPAQRAAFLGSLVFRVESQCVDRRLRWPTGDDLLRMSDLESRGLPPVRMAEAYALLRNDLPLLDDLRRKTIGSNFR